MTRGGKAVNGIPLNFVLDEEPIYGIIHWKRVECFSALFTSYFSHAPVVGVSFEVLILMGARFSPFLKKKPVLEYKVWLAFKKRLHGNW